MKMNRWIGVIALSFLSQGATAGVDIYSGDFTKNFTDAEFRVGPYRWSLIRTFNSKQQKEKTLFGKGWCSTLENRLTLEGSGPVVTICGQGQPVSFSAVAGKANEFVSKSGRSLVKKGESFLREIESGYFEHYSKEGQLTAVSARSGKNLKLIWNGAKLQRIQDSEGRTYQIVYGAAGKLSQLKGSGENLTYAYDSAGLLVRIEQNGQFASQFAYDAQKRLTEITYPDQTKLKLEYGKMGPKVTSLTLRDRCVEKFKGLGEDKRGSLFTSVFELTRECPSKAPQKYKFTQNKVVHKQKGRTLERLVSTKQESKNYFKLTSYHPALQKPARLERNGVSSFLSYDEKGRLTGVRTGDQFVERSFGPQNRIESIATTSFLSNEVPSHREEAKFLYNPKGQWVGLAKSTGEVVRMQVASDGTWRSFSDVDGRALSPEKAYSILRSVDPLLSVLNQEESYP